MLRDPALIPLSRQHQHGLALCVMTSRALSSDGSGENVRKLAERIVDHFEIELTNHFAVEEQFLFPVIERELGGTSAVAELIADHRALESMVGAMRTAPAAELLEQFCDLLRRHIRREENELFEDIQRRLPKDTLAAAGKEIDARVIRVCL